MKRKHGCEGLSWSIDGAEHEALAAMFRCGTIIAEAGVARHRLRLNWGCALQVNAVESMTQTEMQMGPQRIAGAARIAYPLSTFDVLPILDMKAAQVGIERYIAVEFSFCIGMDNPDEIAVS